MLRVASSPRDRLIVRVLAETGCRLGELIGLRVGDLVAQDGQHFLYRVRPSQTSSFAQAMLEHLRWVDSASRS